MRRPFRSRIEPIPILVAMAMIAPSACGVPAAAPTPEAPPWVAVTPGLEPIVRGWIEDYQAKVGPPPFDLVVMPLEAAQDRLRRGQAAMLFAATEPPPGWFATPVGEERIATVVHPTNPVRSLDLRELERLFSGEVVSWAEVGGQEALVQIYVPFPGDDLRAAFVEATLRDRPITPNARLFLDADKGATLVAEDAAALGILPLSAVTSAVRALRVEGSPPQARSNDDPFRLNILAMAPTEPTGGARDFLGWLQSSLQE